MISRTTIPMHPIPGRKHSSFRETTAHQPIGSPRIPPSTFTRPRGRSRNSSGLQGETFGRIRERVAHNGWSCREDSSARQASGKTSVGIHRWIGIKSRRGEPDYVNYAFCPSQNRKAKGRSMVHFHSRLLIFQR